MKAERLVVSPERRFSELAYGSPRRTGTEIVVFTGDFDHFVVSTAYCPGTAGGVFIRDAAGDTFSFITEDGRAHVVYEGDDRFFFVFPGMRPPPGTRDQGDEEAPCDIPEWVAGTCGPYVLLEDSLMRITHRRADPVYQCAEAFDYRIGMAGEIFIRRRDSFFRISEYGNAEKFYTGPCSEWGIGPSDQLILRQGNSLFRVSHDGSVRKFYGSNLCFECRISPSGIFVRHDNTFLEISYIGQVEQVYKRPENEKFCRNWEIGPAGIFFQLREGPLMLVVVL